MKKNCLEFRAVSKMYGNQVILRDISFAIQEYQHTVILGPSGCGKSTALRLLAGLEASTSGDVYIGDALASNSKKIIIPASKRNISMVFQDLGLWPNLTVFENIMLGLSGLNINKEEKISRCLEMLILCKIESLKSRKPGEISGGQQQRVALARSLAAEPKILLFDEPFSGLDFPIKVELLDEISSLLLRTNITVVMVTHDLIEANFFCANAILMRSGEIEHSGNLKELMTSSRVDAFQLFQKHARSVLSTPA